jgi:hypothetical protein
LTGQEAQKKYQKRWKLKEKERNEKAQGKPAREARHFRPASLHHLGFDFQKLRMYGLAAKALVEKMHQHDLRGTLEMGGRIEKVAVFEMRAPFHEKAGEVVLRARQIILEGEMKRSSALESIANDKYEL